MGKEAKYVVRLSCAERESVEQLVARGRVAKATRQRAQVLLRADEGEAGPGASDEQIAELVGVSLSTVHRTRQRLVEEGLEATLHRQPAVNRQYRKLDGAQEAQLVVLACSAPPTGRVRWTMQMLADRLVELEVVDSIGQETVRTTLKKMLFNLGARSNGCCHPPKTPTLSVRWKTSWKSTNAPTIRGVRSSASTSKASS
jgi:transposase